MRPWNHAPVIAITACATDAQGAVYVMASVAVRCLLEGASSAR